MAIKTIEGIITNIIKNCNTTDRSEPLNKILINQQQKNGLYLEFGVWQGYSIKLAKNYLSDWDIFGFDSFEGLPEKWREGFDKGCFDLGGEEPLLDKKINLIKGWFEDTIPIWLQNNRFDYADIIHIDCDLYSSTRTVLYSLKELIKKNTILIFDEMINYPDFENGEIKAFAEFIIDYNVEYEILCSGGYNLEKVGIRITKT